MSSGLIVDRTVWVGRPGGWATFSLAHGWASGEPDEPDESRVVDFYGFREDVDVSFFPSGIRHMHLSRWRTRAEIVAAIAYEMAKRRGWMLRDVAGSVMGHGEWVDHFMATATDFERDLFERAASGRPAGGA